VTSIYTAIIAKLIIVDGFIDIQKRRNHVVIKQIPEKIILRDLLLT
jgi:hypothetical protein